MNQIYRLAILIGIILLTSLSFVNCSKKGGESAVAPLKFVDELTDREIVDQLLHEGFTQDEIIRYMEEGMTPREILDAYQNGTILPENYIIDDDNQQQDNQNQQDQNQNTDENTDTQDNGTTEETGGGPYEGQVTDYKLPSDGYQFTGGTKITVGLSDHIDNPTPLTWGGIWDSELKKIVDEGTINTSTFTKFSMDWTHGTCSNDVKDRYQLFGCTGTNKKYCVARPLFGGNVNLCF